MTSFRGVLSALLVAILALLAASTHARPGAAGSAER